MGKKIKLQFPDQVATSGRRKKKQSTKDFGATKTKVVDEVHNPFSLMVILCFVLSLATITVYSKICSHEFIAYDDDRYVYDNPHVRAGINPANISWALSTFYYANWHPLTWLSHMLDCQLFGLDPGWHHFVNLFFHISNTLLLFLIFTKLTNRPWRSFIIAGIFAIHPLHVESVAWISERKDVLSTFFSMATLLFYIHYVKKPSLKRYVFVALFFGFGLMAKPMVVTVPFILLLLDFWPLKRLALPFNVKTVVRLFGEKIPLFIMVTIASALTFLAQKEYGAVATLGNLPFPERVGNALVSYVNYLLKAIWPINLAVLYPIHPPLPETVVVAAVPLIVITTAAFFWRKKRPYVLVGWFWFLGMLVPVIGIVQVGAQSMADRYMYLPLVGLSLAVVWPFSDLIGSNRFTKNSIVAGTCLIFLLLGLQTFMQTTFWKSSESLFEHTLKVTSRNYIIHNNLGVVLAKKGKNGDAMAHYREALVYNSDYPEAHANLGHELLMTGKYEESVIHLTAALRMNPKIVNAQSDLGTLLAAQGKFEEARIHLDESLQLAPDNPNIQSNLCFVLQHLGKPEDAMIHCKEALRLNPGSLDAHYNLGMVFASQKKIADAISEFSEALSGNPNFSAARKALEQLQGVKGN